MDSSPVRRNVPFKLIVGLALLMVLTITLMNYLERAHAVLEEQSVQQQKRVIDSVLVVMFATYAVDGRLQQLAELDGGNPFEWLKKYDLSATQYRGVFNAAQPGDSNGWFYDSDAGQIFYRSLYLEYQPRYEVKVGYQDVNQNGRLDPGIDNLNTLYLAAASDRRR